MERRHAGPALDFPSLELADANGVDHHALRPERRFGTAIEIAP